MDDQGLKPSKNCPIVYIYVVTVSITLIMSMVEVEAFFAKLSPKN